MTMDWLKSLGRGVGALALVAVWAFTLIGVTAVLVCNYQIHFAVANLVCLTFATKPMFDLFKKLIQ